MGNALFCNDTREVGKGKMDSGIQKNGELERGNEVMEQMRGVCILNVEILLLCDD